MTAKRANIRAELRARCAVFNETDTGSEHAPEGWVEIQANDSIDEGPDDLEVFDSDEHAALAVAEIGGARGCAMLYEIESGLFEPVSLDGLGTRPERAGLLDDGALAILAVAVNRRRARENLRWICVVPRRVAIAAGLDCAEPT